MDHPVLSLDPYTIGCRCTTSSPTGPGVITGRRSLDPLKTSARLTPNHIVPEMLREQGYEVSRHFAFQGEDVINPINPTIERPEKY